MENRNNQKFLSILLLGTLFSILASTFVSAGLVVSPSPVIINKTVGQNAPIIFQVTNTESFDFFNISLDSNNVVSSNTLNTLQAGKSANISATVVTNTAGDYVVPLKGFYISNLGGTNANFNINVSSNNLTSCSFTMIAGDTITWRSFVLDPITLINADTGIPLEGGVIQPNATIQKQFSAGVFRYYFTRANFQITPTCTVTVLGTSGLINNPAYDGNLSLKVSTNFEPTSVSMNTLQSNYTLDFTSSQDGLMSVTNTGTKTAFSVHLSGEWFSFSSNDFNLLPGETKGLIYTISPLVQQTNDTNKTYIKNIVVSGNFQTQTVPITIFIRYADLNGNATDDVNYLLNVFCPRYPTSVLCSPEPQKEYVYVNNFSDAEVNVTMTQKQIEGMFAYLFEVGDTVKTESNARKESDLLKSQRDNETASEIAAIKAKQQEQDEKSEGTKNGILGLIIILCSLVVVACAVGVYFLNRRYNIWENLRRW